MESARGSRRLRWASHLQSTMPRAAIRAALVAFLGGATLMNDTGCEGFHLQLRLGEAAAASGGSSEEERSALRRPRNAVGVKVRRAKERDYPGVARIRDVIIPVGMSGATGFLGGKVVVDSPEEAERRLLMAKVADLVRGEAVALIALEGRRIVGTVDCVVQPFPATDSTRQGQRRPQNLGEGGTLTQSRRGAAASTQPQSKQVFLKNLFVLPAERRRGIARKLVEGAEAFARKEMAATIGLDVAPENTAARELYLRCGFEEAERPAPVNGGVSVALVNLFGLGKIFMVKRV